MKKKVEELETRKEEQNAIDASGGSCEEIKQFVKTWSAEVNEIMGKAKDLVIEDNKRAKTTGSYWTLLNLKPRHQQRTYVALKDDNINLVGLRGMAGVGKTTLVREVSNKQVKEEKLFNEVVIAIVMQSPDLIRIQGEIADKLVLKLDKETLSGRADLLGARLSKEKNQKILVILDDIWKKLDLDEIGIPCNGCKVVVTSRNRDILSCEMGTQKGFVLNELPQEEAWSLFEKMVGDSLKDQNLQSISTEVSKECAGLPLGLVTVAKALKNKNETEWKDALQQLRQPSSNNRTKMQEVIYSSIQLNYDNLENPGVTKSFFLLCAHEMNPGIDYTDLLKYCFGLQLFHCISTLEETRIKMDALVQSLKDSCLLLDGPHTCQCVLMHNLVRDAAIFIASKAQTVLTMRSDGTVKWPEFPREIGLLTHLRLLDLRNCTKLEVIPPNVLSGLIQLEELYVSISFTQWEIQGVYNERASLAELKHLSRLTTLEVHIPDANMLPKDIVFKNLKRYKISIGDVWDWTDKHENSRALTLKLSTSFQLESAIKMWLNGIEYLCLDELKGVESVIYELDVKGFQQLKHLHVQNNAEIKYIVNLRELVIADVIFPALEIFSLKKVTELEEMCCGQLPLTSFSNLTNLKVEQCDKLKFVFSLSMAKGLSQLQELEIRECNILGAIIIKEEGGTGIKDRYMILFPRLHHLVLHRLPKLMSFLSVSIINDAEEIIPECNHDFNMPVLQEQVEFPNLQTLKLSSIDLEEMQHNQHQARSSLELSNIQRFKNLTSLKMQGSGTLKYLLSSSTASSMGQLKYLVIEDCKVMEEARTQRKALILPCNLSSMKRFLVRLEDLHVVECGLEEIVALEDGAEAAARLVFPKVTLLMLKNMPKLKWFSRGLRTSKWPLLKVL
nr:putative disease resistance protein [Quercus suber]